MNQELLELKTELLDKLLTQIEILKLITGQIDALYTEIDNLNKRIDNIQNKPQTII